MFAFWYGFPVKGMAGPTGMAGPAVQHQYL